jgi:hypothetical protein
VPSKKKRRSPTNYDSILFVITRNNDIFELQSLLEHNDYTCKLIIKIIHLMLVFPTCAIKKIEQKNSSNKRLKI